LILPLNDNFAGTDEVVVAVGEAGVRPRRAHLGHTQDLEGKALRL